jgi:hypothetical protein
MKIIRPRLAFLNSAKSLSNFQGYVPVSEEQNADAYFFDMLYFKQSAISPIEIVQMIIYDKKYKSDLVTAPPEKLDKIIKTLESSTKSKNSKSLQMIYKRAYDPEKNEFTENGIDIELGKTLTDTIFNWLNNNTK